MGAVVGILEAGEASLRTMSIASASSGESLESLSNALTSLA